MKHHVCIKKEHNLSKASICGRQSVDLCVYHCRSIGSALVHHWAQCSSAGLNVLALDQQKTMLSVLQCIAQVVM